ncbi:hypothetical protein HOY82DRAFT_544594 [Tuber indicum]|nr:hypothetical protein HOY82DRAFT_544594 [Tuber indicum]
MDPASKRAKPPPEVSNARRLLILSLRYAISPKEYAVLRHRILIKGPGGLRAATPSKTQFDAVCYESGRDDSLPATSRAGLRVFLLSNVVLNLWDVGAGRLARRRRKGGNNDWAKQVIETTARKTLFKSPNFLFSLSLGTLVVAHRLLYRFFFRLRENLLLPQARTFRLRHPKVAKLFLSRLSPPIGSALAGLALLIHPSGNRRTTVSAWTFVKALEFCYNRLEDEGWFQNKPWWFGSWMLFPIASGQLLYAFVFDRDCFPPEYGNFIMGYSKEYLQARPVGYPGHLQWPGTYDIVDSIGKIAGLNYPPFNSAILYPDANPLPKFLQKISPIVSPAHPTITSLQCALLHPQEPSCLKTYLAFWASEFTSIAKFMSVVYAISWLPRYKAFLRNPAGALGKLSRSTLLTTTFITGSIGTSWGMTCLFQKLLPRHLLPKGRFWLGGFVGGLWALVDSGGGRGNFLYTFRVGLVSAWKVLAKKGYVRGVKNGDVYLFILALAVINSLFDTGEHAVSGSFSRRVLGSMRGRGLKDPVKEAEKALEKGKGKEIDTSEIIAGGR